MDLLDFGGVFPVLLLFAGMGVRSNPSTVATMRSLRARGEGMAGRTPQFVDFVWRLIR